MTNAPWFRIYPAELLSDEKIALLDDDQLGKLLKLWAFAAQHECTIPSSEPNLAKLLRISERKMKKNMIWVKQFFVEISPDDPDRLVSLRLQEEYRAYRDKCDKNRDNGFFGGRPRKQKEAQSETDGFSTEKRTDSQTKPKNNRTRQEVGSTEKEKESTPLSPQGGFPRRRRKLQCEDCTPEVLPFVQKIYDLPPKDHPMTHEPVHKGPFVEACRAIQQLVDAKILTPTEAVWVAKIYYGAEDLERTNPGLYAGLTEAANNAWDFRPKAMLMVATLFGPKKKAYMQLLPLARKAMARYAESS